MGQLNHDVLHIPPPADSAGIPARSSPLRFLIIIIAAIFMAEVVAMLVVYFLSSFPYSITAFIDAGIMTILIAPVLYFLSFRPLLRHIKKNRQAEESLLHSRELQERFFDSIGTLIAYMDRDFSYIRVNEAYAQAGGYPPEYFIGKNHFELNSHPENRAIFQRVVETGEAISVYEQPFEDRDQPERGTTYWNWSLQPVRSADGSVDGAVLSLVDVTERKRAEEELRKAYDELELRVHERTEELRIANSELQEEIIERKRAEEALQEANRNLNMQTVELEMQADELNAQKDELVVANEHLCVSEELANQRLMQIENLYIQLKEVAEKYSTLFNSTSDGVWIHNLKGEILEVNDAYCRMSCYTRDELTHMPISALEAIEFPEEVADHIKTVIEAGGHDRFESRHRRKDGSTFDVDVTALYFENYGGRIAIFVRDITERKQAEETLKRAHDELESRVQERTKELEVTNRELSNEIIERKEVERQLLIQAAAMEAAANGIVITDPLGNILWMNQAVTQMTGYTNDELHGQNMRVFRSGRHDAGFYRQMRETILEGQVWHGEMINRRKDGNLYVEEQTITPVRNESGQISQFIAVKQDVTERQLIHAQLEQSNRELQAISALEHQQRLISEVLSKASVALSQTLDIERVMETVLDYIQLVLPLDVAFVVLSEGNDRYGIRSVRSSGQHDLAGALLNQSFDLLSDPMIRPFFEKQTSTLIPDTDAFETWKPSGELASMHTWLGIPLISASQIIGMVVSANRKPNSFRDDQIKLAEAVVGQATVALQNAWLFEQVRAGRERLQYLSRRLVETQESERRFIARELHDQAGQSLSSLILGLGQLERDADKPGKIQPRVGKLKALTNDILEDLHRLAVNLRPASLDHLGLVPALDQFIKSFADRSHLKIHFKAVGIGESDRLPTDVETTLYRIVQEALTNVARHAQASHADIILERRTGSLLLIVEDNGTGFDPELPRTDTHLGLLGMHERAETLGGSLTIESVPGQGTTLVVEVPDVDPDPTGG